MEKDLKCDESRKTGFVKRESDTYPAIALPFCRFYVALTAARFLSSKIKVEQTASQMNNPCALKESYLTAINHLNSHYFSSHFLCHVVRLHGLNLVVLATTLPAAAHRNECLLKNGTLFSHIL